MKGPYVNNLQLKQFTKSNFETFKNKKMRKISEKYKRNTIKMIAKQSFKASSKRKKLKNKIPYNKINYSRENINYIPRKEFENTLFSSKRTNNNLLKSIYNNRYNENNNYMVNFFLNKISKKKGNNLLITK